MILTSKIFLKKNSVDHHRRASPHACRGQQKGSEDQAKSAAPRGGLSTKYSYGRSRPGMSGAVHSDRCQKGDAPQSGCFAEGLPCTCAGRHGDTATTRSYLRHSIACQGALAVIPNTLTGASNIRFDKHPMPSAISCRAAFLTLNNSASSHPLRKDRPKITGAVVTSRSHLLWCISGHTTCGLGRLADDRRHLPRNNKSRVLPETSPPGRSGSRVGGLDTLPPAQRGAGSE